MKRSIKQGMVLTAALILSQPIFAQAQTIHTVKHGDYLWKIATQYGISVQQLKDWNSLTSNYIYSGNQLVVSTPQKVSKPVAETTVQPTQPQVIETTASPVIKPAPVTINTPVSSTTYTVQKGDYLYKIAQQFGVSIQDLKRWNHLNNNYIYTGNRLIVADPGQVSSTPVVEETTVAPQPQRPVDSHSSAYHTVQKGDYLYKIARKYGVSIQNIKSWNGMSSNVVHVGQRLKVSKSTPVNSQPQPAQPKPVKTTVVNPSTPTRPTKPVYTPAPNVKVHVVKKGDYLYKIAQEHGLTVDQLKAWNRMSDNNVHVNDHLYLTQANPINFSEPTRQLPENIRRKTVGGRLTPEAKNVLHSMNVTLVGDSIAVGIQDLLSQNGFKNYNVNTKVSRRWTHDKDTSLNGLYALQELKRSGLLNEYVVFILGTNYGATQTHIDQAMAMVGNRRKVLFVDTASEVEVAPTVNALYANNTLNYDNAYYVDWSNPASKYPTEYFNPEYSAHRQRYIRLHPNNVGKRVLSEYIAQALYQVKQQNAEVALPKPVPTVSTKKIYTVQKGDYLYKIAQQYGITVNQLRQWNGLTSNFIYSGDQLIVAL